MAKELKKQTKEELINTIQSLEQELHESNNSAEYWSHEYHKLLEAYEALKISDEPIQIFLASCSIIDKSKVEDFINSL